MTSTPLFELCLLAIQGPEAASILSKIIPGVNLDKYMFMTHFWNQH